MSSNQDLLEQARHIARIGAAELLAGRPDVARNSQVFINTKTSPTDVVTERDLASEKAILNAIKQIRPGDGVVGEEGTNHPSSTGLTWVIDPLDGTINYLYGSTQWAVSVAVQDEVGGLVGVVYAPLVGHEYYAVRGEGAFRVDALGEVRLPMIADDVELGQALFATGFGYKTERRRNQARVISEVLPQIRDIRRKGSAALDICMAASGMVNGYFERGANPWDYAAAAVVARETGLIVSGLRGVAESPEMVVAAPPRLHAEITNLLESLNADSGD